MYLEDLRAKRKDITAIMDKYGAENIRVFGSVAQRTARSDSDVDFLVTLREETSLFDLGCLYMDLREFLGCEVDVVSETAVSKHMREDVLNSARPL